MSEIELRSRYDTMDKVIDLKLKGKSETIIARELNMKRAEVVTLVEEWQTAVRSSNLATEHAKESLAAMDKQYNMLKDRLWRNADDARANTDLKLEATTLKAIADIEAKRVEILQKAGLMEDAALGDQLAQMEKDKEVIVGIIRDVVGHCENCKYEVSRRLAQVTGQVEPIKVQTEVVTD